MPFALDGTASTSELSDAVNYLLANFGANIIADPNTGIITGPGGQIIGYLYKYLAVKYADSQDGALNFSDSPTDRLYYGLRNSDDPVESTNPADYVWYQVTGGFSTTKTLWYKTTGNRAISFLVAPTTPGAGWAPVPTTSIDLDILTAVVPGANSFIASFQPSSVQVPRSGSPLVPSFTGITPALYGYIGNTLTNFVAAQSDSDVTFIADTWRIGQTSTTGYGDIVYLDITIGSPTAVSGRAQWPQPTAMANSPAYITVPVRYKNAAGVVTQLPPVTLQFVFSDQGAYGLQQATAYLYQWSPTTPTNPSGNSTYDWTTGTNTGYTGGGGWSTTVPANPGTPGIYLWAASKAVSAVAGTTASTVSWSGGFSVVATNGNGIDGAKTASPTVYQWAATIPTITGTSTYTWASGTFTPVPAGWSTSITSSPSPGFTLWAAVVNISDTASATTTSINWTTASIIASGYSGTNGLAGASSRIMFARIAGNPTPVSGTVTVSGDNRPTGAQGAAVWGASFNVSWSATDPNPSSNDSLYQSDGIYNGTNTSWSTPYISSLKVGQLSAITVNTGALTAQDSITVSTTGNIKGGQTGYATGTGFFLGYSGGAYKFSIGNATNYLNWDGSALKFTGDIDTNGDALFFGNSQTPSAVVINGTAYFIDFCVQAAGISNASSSGVIRAGVYADVTAATSQFNIALIGIAPSSTKGFGIYASGGERGAFFQNTSTGGVAAEIKGFSASDVGLFISEGTFSWGSYTWSKPNGDGKFLRNDGTWTNAVVSNPTNSGTATVNSSSQISLLGSTSTGIAGAYVGTSGSGSTVTFEIQTTSPSDRRLKQDIEDVDIGLEFVNQLKPKKYRLKADPRQQIGYGFIADEVTPLGVEGTSLVYHEPNWKVGDEQGFDTIHYPSYVAVLTKAIQELSAKVEQLTEKVKALESAA